MKRVCLHSTCERAGTWKGRCPAHAQQWRRWGYTRDIGWRPSITTRILAQAVAEGECLTWTGFKLKNGYGYLSWNGPRWLVHRAIYTESIGPIPEGLTIDHLCRNRACVNTAHMEVVTVAENSRRGGGLEKAWAKVRAKTHCKHGHEFTAENTRLYRGGRICRECSRTKWREWAVRKGLRRAEPGRRVAS